MADALVDGLNDAHRALREWLLNHAYPRLPLVLQAPLPMISLTVQTIILLGAEGLNIFALARLSTELIRVANHALAKEA